VLPLSSESEESEPEESEPPPPLQAGVKSRARRSKSATSKGLFSIVKGAGILWRELALTLTDCIRATRGAAF